MYICHNTCKHKSLWLQSRDDQFPRGKSEEFLDEGTSDLGHKQVSISLPDEKKWSRAFDEKGTVHIKIEKTWVNMEHLYVAGVQGVGVEGRMARDKTRMSDLAS